MKNYGKVQSSVRPAEIEMTDTKVFIASNITSFEKEVGGYLETGFEYDYVEYSKDELLTQQAQRITQLEEELAAAKILLGVE